MSNLTGVYRAVVHDLTDPAKRGRARLLVPAIYGNAVSGWANPVFANSSTKVGDLAWVMFENADINRPAWMAVQPGPNLEELDARYPLLEHEHDVEDLTATGTPSATTYLRGDSTWATPPDTTYSVQSQAEVEDSTSTAARLTTGQRIFQAISKWAVTLANAQTIAGRKLFSTELGMTQIATPGTPPAGQNALYTKADNGLYLKDSDGTERPVWSSASPWIDYTPVWTGSTTNPVLNNGTLTGRYRWTSPDTVEYEIRLTMGSTTTYGAGQWRWSLPVPINAAYAIYYPIGTCIAVDSGSRMYEGEGLNAGVNNSVFCWRDIGATEASYTPTTPHTWASTDILFIKGSYQTSSSWPGANIGYSPTVLATAIHLNPDYEIPNGGVPLNWNFFWGNGTRTVSMDTTPANVRSGTNSLKIVTAAAADQRAMSTTFDVPTNAVVRNSVWVKAAAANTTVNLGGFFADSGTNPEFFGSDPGLGFDGQDFVIGTDWQKITYTKACSPSTRRYRQMLSVGASSTVWFDQSETEIIGGGYRAAPGWVDYTPTWRVGASPGSNPSGTGGLLSGKYLLHSDGMVDFEIQHRLGSSHTTTAGNWSWALPFPAIGPSFGYKSFGHGLFWDDSASGGYPTFPYLASLDYVGTLNINGIPMSISQPVAQVWGDAVYITGRYRRT